jgi:hypoxanthine phosphoribosyltransferase
MNPMRKELLSWNDIDKLIDHLIPQMDEEFDAMLMITRGGMIPGGMLAEAMGVEAIYTASVNFPAQSEAESAPLLAWPQFLMFPEDHLLRDSKLLIVDDVWGSGRTITSVKNRVSGAGGVPYTCVMHFNPHRSLFGTARPDYYAAITDAHIIYPWEINRGPESVLLRDF